MANPSSLTVEISSGARRCVLLADPGEAHGKFDVLCDGQPREQRRLLEHHRYAPVDLDGAGARRFESGDEVEDRRLAAPGGADQADELASLDVQVEEPSAVTAPVPVPKVLSTPAKRTMLTGPPPRAVPRPASTSLSRVRS